MKQEAPGLHDASEIDLDVEDSNALEARKRERAQIAKKEGKLVFVLRMLVVVVLILSAIGVSVGVYLYTTNQETEEFQTKFDSDAAKVLESIGTTFEQTLGSTDAFITQLVAYARYSDSQWPFVTLPAFAIHATKLLKLSKSFYFSLYPFVEPWERDDWQEYANVSDAWIYESFDVQATDEDWWGDVETTFEKSYDIFSGGEFQSKPYEYMSNYLPTWQMHPVVPKAGWGRVYNYDIWSVDALAQGILAADEKKRVVVSPQVNAIYDPTSEESIEEAKSQSDWAAYFAKPGTDTSEPFSVITFPIYDSLEAVRLDTTKNNTLVAVLMVSLFWRELLVNTLPEGSDGVVVVFSDPCSPSFTYRLDGPEAIYMGQGDLHDPKYDDYGVEHKAILPDLASPTNKGDGTSSYTGLPIHESYCLRTITVYPSNDMKDNHTTKDPVVFTIVAACIFLFTSAIFIAYDFWVGRRQQIILRRALESGAIVDSLFPTNVQQQLYQEQNAERQDEKANKTFQIKKSRTDAENGVERQKAIADHYENCTIFFADLVGFTAWSATRKPDEVFELLETIYGQFDRIAKARKVFKVETVGDCYVAITGCPDPQRHHARNMALFAHDCMLKLREVLISLSERLGEDTRTLTMRCGLHSGSVTAGVLRGEKGRFQLFGANVNEAARMEQTGLSERIHASQGFANALIADGKGNWLSPRGDKVYAKGYGEVSTYWVNVVSDGKYSDAQSMLSGNSGSTSDESGSSKGGRGRNQLFDSSVGNKVAFTEVDV